MRLLLFMVALSLSASAPAAATGIDGGTSGASDSGVGSDAPFADVVKVDGGWYLTDARMVKVGAALTKPCPAVPQPEAQPEPGFTKPFLYGVAAGAVSVAIAVVVAIAWGASR